MRALASAAGAVGVVLMFSGITAPAVSRSRGPALWLGRIAAEAGWTRTKGTTLAFYCVVCAVLLAIFATAFTGSAVLGLSAGGVGGAAPILRARSAAVRRRQAIAHCWPDAIASIIAGVRAGIALPECCQALAAGGPAELRAAFQAFAATYGATGSFEAALSRVQDVLQEPVADRVIAVLLMTHQVGGNDLVRVLRASSDMVREDMHIRNEVKARWSWTVTAAKVAAAAPVIVLVLMGARPEGAAAYTSPAGVTTVLAGSVATWVGYRLMLRAARLPEDQRMRT